jgi:ABC-type glycerol-3-phosphate transport system substrate-binding protein
MALGTYEGTADALPLEVDLVTLYMNLATFEGRPEGTEFSNIEDLDAFLDELWARGKLGFVPTYPGWFPHIWPILFGGSWFASNGSFSPDDPTNVAAFDWVVSFRRRFQLDDFAAPVNPVLATDHDPFVAGHVAMVLDGDWLVQGLVAQPGLEWRCASFPAPEGPAALVVADVVAIPTGARCPEGAEAFLRFAATQESLERIALAQSKISPLAAWSPDFLTGHPNPQIRTLRAILQRVHVVHDPRIPGWLRYLDRIKSAFAEMWSPSRSPHDALAGIK